MCTRLSRYALQRSLAACDNGKDQVHHVAAEWDRRGIGCQGQRRHQSSLAESFKVAKWDAHEALRQSVNVQTVFRTEQNDPSEHCVGQEGLFYTVPPAESTQLLQRAVSKDFLRQANTFNETCLMIRRPALELIHYLKHLNLNHTAPKFVLYGRRGAGKTMTMAHVIHYCSLNNWVIVHTPWAPMWTWFYRETSQSAHKSHRIDLPWDAADWLVNFRQQNLHLLRDIKLSHCYVWTKRETSEEGSPLLNIVDFGLARMKYASDCVGAIMKELRIQAQKNKIKVLVVVDGVNAFWNQTTIKNDQREYLMADQVSLVHNSKKMIESTWSHGAIVCSVDAYANVKENREGHNPRYLLGKEGFEFLDPFIPVHVPYYSQKEAYSCLEYYLDRNWIQNERYQTKEGKKELLFLSNQNPFQLMRLCASK